MEAKTMDEEAIGGGREVENFRGPPWHFQTAEGAGLDDAQRERDRIG